MTHGMLVSSCKRLFVTRNLHAKLLCEDSGSINTNCWLGHRVDATLSV